MDSSEHPTLPGLAVAPNEAPLSLKPAVGRSEPPVWVAKLAVYGEWPPSSETLLRKMQLRRGLNILWAKPTGATNEASRLAGHGAGKTTFCRLLRYALDEAVSGSPDFLQGFSERFRVGWLLAEVYVSGHRWLVGRPIVGGIGYHSFAKKDGLLTDEFPAHPPRAGYDEYRAAFNAAVFGGMKLRTLAASQETLDWPRLLPWLSRDQEAHFSGLLEWRHKLSDSRSPDLSAPDKENLVRLMLGLVAEEEQELLRQHAKKAQDHEQGVRDRAKLEFAVERDRKKLEDAIKAAVAGPNDTLLQQEVNNLVTALRAQTDAAVASTKHDEEIDRLVAEVGKREAEWAIVSAWVEEIADKVELEEARLTGLQPPTLPPKKTEDVLKEALRDLGPFPGYCSHPMDKAWRAQCPIAFERPKDDEVTAATDNILAEAKPKQVQLVQMRAELARREKATAPKERALNDAREALQAARKRRNEELDHLKVPAQEAAQLEAAFTNYRTACKDLEDLNSTLVTLDREKKELDAQLDELAQRHSQTRKIFGRLFNHIAQRMLGQVVTGRVEFSGKGIVPMLEYHGPRDSAALKVTKWLAFDLAALALSMTTDIGHHPRFLMHDSPRESDLVATIYRELFWAAHDLEVACGDAAAFQYVVTTTEPPPEELKKSPWLLEPSLDASTPGGRFLGVDL